MDFKPEVLTAKRREFWKDRRVFVTGAFGLLGSTITELLVRMGASVVVMQRDHVPSSRLFETEAHKRVAVVRGDFEDYDLVSRTLNDYEIETVFHVGAQAIAPIANRAPLSTFKTNIMGTANVLEAARLAPTVKRVVVASSDKAYGDQPILPYTEDAPLQGRHPYDVSKSCTDLLAQCYFKTYKLPVCITRCGNLYGPGDLNFNRIVPETIKMAAQDKPLMIRSDGTFVRDYFFMRDAANGYLTIAENMDRPEIVGQAFNLSTGNGMTVLKIVDHVLTALNKTHLQPVILNQAKAEIHDQTLSSEKAGRLLGWKPMYTVEEGLAETVAWYTDYFRKQDHASVPSTDALMS